MYRKPSRLTSTIVKIVDCICIAVSILMAYLVRFGAYKAEYKGVAIETTIGILCGVYLITSILWRGRNFYSRGYLDELFHVALINLLVMVIAVFVLYALHVAADYSRIMFFLYVAFAIVLEYISHIILKKILPMIYVMSAGTRNILLIGDEKYICKYVADTKESGNEGVNVIGCCLLGTEEYESQELSIVCTLDQIEEYCVQNPIDEIYIRGNDKNANGLDEILDNLMSAGITIHYEVDIPKLLNAPESFIERENDAYYITYSKKLISTVDLVLKRCMDIIGGLIGSIATCILFVLIAPAIKLTSKGPVLFTQDRVGKNGRIIKIAKFRSMVVDAEELKSKLEKENEMDGIMFKMEHDPRITKVGKFIRKTSLDEFPQFFSVLKGDMSLVGTRPPTLDEYEQYNLKQKSRLAFKPGLTGLWQVSGRNSIKNFDDIVELDNKYIQEWSLYQDIKILIKTVPAMLSGR